MSRSLKTLPPALATSVALKADSVQELYHELEQTGARQVYIDGGQTIQSFLNAGLVDEIILTRVPVLIGRDIPSSVCLIRIAYYSTSAALRLRMVSCKAATK